MGIKRGYVYRKIGKVGNSIGITIPKEFLMEINVVAGDVVLLSVKDKSIKIRRIKNVRL